MTMTTTQAMMALTVGVEEAVGHMFGDMIETGQGIGTSDLGGVLGKSMRHILCVATFNC